MIFSIMILRFMVSKEGKLLDPKKIQAIVNMFVPTNPQQIQIIFNDMAYFCKKLCIIMPPITKFMQRT